MHAALRQQLRNLDRVLLSMLDERARLVASVAADDASRKAAVDDMLARHDGPFPAKGITEVFQAIDRHCAEFAAKPTRSSAARSSGEARHSSGDPAP